MNKEEMISILKKYLAKKFECDISDLDKKGLNVVKNKQNNKLKMLLFYDLIFVYAISRLTTLIKEPANGIMHPFFVYLIISFVILQAWLYFTNYINRYGKWELHDYILTIVNMIAVLYMANTINTQWNQMVLPFNISMLVMFLTVIGLYYFHDRKQETKNNAAHNSIKIITSKY